jgi:hypothetical protein
MIYELRVYDAVPGKMPALLQRFEKVTLGVWKKHGIKPVGFWTTYIGESNQKLYYMLKWDSLADREQRWATFQADENWIRKRAESEKDGPLVATFSNTIITPTKFSALK